MARICQYASIRTSIASPGLQRTVWWVRKRSVWNHRVRCNFLPAKQVSDNFFNGTTSDFMELLCCLFKSKWQIWRLKNNPVPGPLSLRRVRVIAYSQLSIIASWFITPLHDTTDPWKPNVKLSFRVPEELYNFPNEISPDEGFFTKKYDAK